MNKKILIYILTAVFFLSATLLGVSAVYRVDTVTVDATIVSETAQEDVEKLQESLYEAYNKDSIFFADKKEAKKVMVQFPNFRLLSFKKSFPNRLIIKVEEATEMYAVPLIDEEGKYYILSPDGIILDVRNSYVNSLDGENNILIHGLSSLQQQNGQLVGDDYLSAMISFCRKASEVLGGLRRNVQTVEIIRMTSSEDETLFRIKTCEGVMIYVGYPKNMTEEKAQAAFEKYLSLSAEQRMKGRIAVSDKSGEIIVSYAEKDDFIA